MAMAMRFWGVEAKVNEPLQVSLEYGYVIHISQVTLSDIMKNDETVTVNVKTGGQSLVLGRLSRNTPQLSFDIIFGKDFEISHDWKNGSIHLMGYQTDTRELESESESEPESDSESSDEDVPLLVDIKSKPEENGASDEDESSEEGDSEDDSDEETGVSDSDGDEEDSDDVKDETPVKAVADKKRPNADAKPPKSKKAKIIAPPKTEVKKGVKNPNGAGKKKFSSKGKHGGK